MPMLNRRLGSRTPPVGKLKRHRRRGQSVVEFALALPLLILVLLLTIDFGRVFLGWVELNNMARIGANFAALNPQAWEGAGIPALQDKYATLISADARTINCTLPTPVPPPVFPDPNPNTYALGSRAQVGLTCKFRLITPLISALIGDSNQDVAVSASSEFAIRGGTVAGIPIAATIPTPTPTSTPSPTPTPTPPIDVSFYGTPTSLNSAGGGPPGSIGENQIVGVPSLVVSFTNTTTPGGLTPCLWNFGDGQTSSSCGGPAHTYATRGTYTVTLTVSGITASRGAYVLVGCQVPDFHGVLKNNASGVWTGAGFAAANLTKQNGGGNYSINFQSLASGTLNPVGGCAGATITVGP